MGSEMCIRDRYIGDPINTVRIFNEKCIDEMIVTDISAGNNGIDFNLLTKIAAESFFPMTYGGGITQLSDVEKIINLGFEKVSVQLAALKKPNFIRELTKEFGRQSLVLSIDFKKTIFGKYKIYTKQRFKFNSRIFDFLEELVDYGAGELHINSVDRDGSLDGYDIELVSEICNTINIPVIVSGGLSCMEDIHKVKILGASAAAGGSFFIYYGNNLGVLMNYPTETDLLDAIGDRFA